jgi:hypothetical protein
MTDHVVRLYALAGALLVLFLVWAGIAARPWAARAHRVGDPRVAALVVRERQLRRDAVHVRWIVARRWQRYRIALRTRQKAIAAAQRRHQQALAAAARLAAAPATAVAAPSVGAPSVRVVTLPPLTITRTS